MSETPNPFAESTQDSSNTDSVEQAVILPNAPHEPVVTRSYRRHSFFWPIALIGFGILLLLSNLGYFPSGPSLSSPWDSM